MNNMNNLLLIIFIIIFIIIFFYFVNNLLIPVEHMTVKNIRLNKILNENNYEIDTDNSCIKKNNNIIYKYESNNFNSFESHYTAKNKPLTNSIFSENNIPVPDHVIIDKSNKDNFILPDKIKFPCVLKPVDGMQGKDVNTFIKNIDQFNKILKDLLSRYDKIMLENQVYGNNYRIFIFNDKIIDVIEREQPFVVGDGNKDIDTLIKDKNELQKKNNLFPTNNIDWNYIEEQGFLKDKIPNKNKKVFITNTINFHNGANPVRISIDKIPKINQDIFIEAHKLIKLHCSGLDYMSPDITVSYKDNNGHIIEINDMVDTKIHVDADHGKDPDFLFKNIVNTFA